jgi:hypothetical protein
VVELASKAPTVLQYTNELEVAKWGFSTIDKRGVVNSKRRNNKEPGKIVELFKLHMSPQTEKQKTKLPESLSFNKPMPEGLSFENAITDYLMFLKQVSDRKRAVGLLSKALRILLVRELWKKN